MLARVLAFYNLGRKKFNRNGWLQAKRLPLREDLSGKIYVVTGANSGIGKCLVDHLYSRGATVYMICRNYDRAMKTKSDISEKYKNEKLNLDSNNLQLIIADVSIKADVEDAVKELKEQLIDKPIDALVCNAGAMLSNKQMTIDNVETTFACHFLFGTYYLGKLCLPLLERSDQSRLIIVSSGGQYTVPLKPFNELLLSPSKKFNGQITYAYAKRAQVQLAQVWSEKFPQLKIISTHPGWTMTPGCD